MNTRIDSNEQMTRVMFFLIPALFLGLIYLLPLILSTEEIRALAIEDGVVEYVGALFFLLASLTFFALYFGKNGRPSSRNIFYLLLGLGFLFVCLEEISWGQRILGFSTPESIRQTNAQGEFNIHNLKVFHGKTETGERKSFWGLLLNADRLFSMFWFFVLLPNSACISLCVTEGNLLFGPDQDADSSALYRRFVYRKLRGI